MIIHNSTVSTFTTSITKVENSLSGHYGLNPETIVYIVLVIIILLMMIYLFIRSISIIFAR